VKYAAVLLAFGLAGCSAFQQRAALDAEELLTQAGFRREPLAEPGLPERQLVEGAGTYKFADAKFCACVYVGGANEYAALQRLRAERTAEREWIMSRGALHAGAADRTAWSAWKPEGLDLEPAAVARR
jgi:hypothetical protein